MTLEALQVRKDDLSTTRIAREALPSLADGEALVKIERFALTANNITYGVVGEKIGYWTFFPAPEGWGIIPVWGFASVTQSRAAGVAEGERLYGYFPMASHLVLTPGKLRADRLVDLAGHRSALPPVYNSYARLAGEADYDASMDEERALLHPLYATSFCLYDFLIDNKWFGAEQVIVASASSKTAIGLAFALHDDAVAPVSVGLTSARNRDKVSALQLYDSVATYDRLDAIDAAKPSVIVDMSGDGAMLAALHARLGENMRYCSNVGVTHYEESGMKPGFIRERSAMFFAPGHIQKRAADWGPGVVEQRARAFWKDAAIRSRGWLSVERMSGARALEAVFHELREGRVGPERGLIASL